MELHDHIPLSIREGSGTELLSYKTPWNRETAAMPLRSTDKYEYYENSYPGTRW